MKTILLSILAAFLLFVPNAAAHTYLDTTNPDDGAIVVEPLHTIELTYSGKIEQGSTFKVIASNGDEIETNTITLVDGVLTGTFENPLPNDNYTVQWNSISEDGHPLSGEFSFTVDAPVTEEVIEEDEAVEQTEVDDTAQAQNEVTEPAVADEDEESKNSPIIIVGIILLLIILVSIIALVKRKKTK